MSVATKRKELSALTSQEVGYLLCQLGLDKHVGSFHWLCRSPGCRGFDFTTS